MDSITTHTGYGDEPPPGYEKTLALRQALDRGLAAWRASPPGEPRYLATATLHAALRYLQAGYRLDNVYRELILRSALHHGVGIRTALAHQQDAETVADVVVEALIEASPPLSQEILWQMQGVPVGSRLHQQDGHKTPNPAFRSTAHRSSRQQSNLRQSWEPIAAERLRVAMPRLGLRRRAHVAAALYQLETGLPVLETVTRHENSTNALPSARGWFSALSLILAGVGTTLLIVLVLSFFAGDDFLPGDFRLGGFRAPVTEVVSVVGGYYPSAPHASVWQDSTEDIDEIYAGEIYVEAYRIMRTEVTNRAYRACVAAGACHAPMAPDSATRVNYFLDPAFADYPVVQVRWHDAAAYCAWREMRLPTAREWEVAAGYSPLTARWYRFPWGDRFEPRFANSAAEKHGDTRPVSSYHPHGNSPLGVRDMAGNVAEWTASPGNVAGAELDNDTADDTGAATGEVATRVDTRSEATMIVKGGSFLDSSAELAVAAQRLLPLNTAVTWLGFRCAR